MSKFTKLIAPAALLLAVTTATSANAWERNRATTGPNGGTVSSWGSGSCSGGSCSSSQGVTGRYGRTATRSGSASCAGGSCSGNATYTGPAGRSVTRSRSFRR